MHKNNHVPGINSKTRTFGILRGFEDDAYPLPQPSPPQLLHPPPGYISNMSQSGPMGQMGQNGQFNPALRDRGGGGGKICPDDDDEDEDEDEDEPIIESCCFCCNLGIGILLGALCYLIFDTIFLARKAQKLFFTDIITEVGVMAGSDEEPTGTAQTALQITSVIFSAFSCLASFILIMSVCLCGVPEKMKTLKFVTRYWMVQIGMNALFQSVENLYNTLPDPESVFVLELPGIGVPEVLGQIAVIITWVFTVGYLFGYFFMVVMILSHQTVLKRMSKKRIISFYERRKEMQKRVFDNDQQSQLTFTERLSDSSLMSRSPPMEDSNYQDIGGMSDVTGLDDLYSMRKVPIHLPPIPEQQMIPTHGAINPTGSVVNPNVGGSGADQLLQAQLAMLHPIQKFQFLQQQIQNHQMANLQRTNSQKPSAPKKTDDDDSEISVRSKPNSNGHNVRFEDLEKPKEMGDNRLTAPCFGPRPPCYVPEWSPTQWLGNPQMVQPSQIPNIPLPPKPFPHR